MNYHLKIVVTSDFPEHILSVFDINDDIPNDFNHFLTDGSYSVGRVVSVVLAASAGTAKAASTTATNRKESTFSFFLLSLRRG